MPIPLTEARIVDPRRAARPVPAGIVGELLVRGPQVPSALLADDGVSISNLFTGDAPKAAMTMSRLEVSRGSRRTRQVFARFLIRPDGLVRSFSRTVAENRNGSSSTSPTAARRLRTLRSRTSCPSTSTPPSDTS